MRNLPSDIAFTPAVKAIQERKGSRQGYARMERGPGWQTTITPDLAAFTPDLGMFYPGTATADGQPYIQYRGGPPGFLKVTPGGLEGRVITAPGRGRMEWIRPGRAGRDHGRH